MNIDECFLTHKYKKIEANDKNVIIEFLEDDEKSYCKPLQSVYSHSTNHEMFLILDCLGKDISEIKEVCNEWEQKVLGVVNFNKEYRRYMEFLKYNIYLVVLVNKNMKYIYEQEKSIKICRKIFIICNGNGEVDEREKIILPFYFEPLKQIKNNTTEELEKQMMNLLPKDNEIQGIFKKTNLVEDDINQLYRWLEENDNQ